MLRTGLGTSGTLGTLGTSGTWDWGSLLLLLIVATGAVLRFTGLSWGAPYFHFHIDEHFVMQGADMLRRSLREAAESAKFFMYGPLPMWMLNGVRAIHDWFFAPLVLTVNRDEITYMVMGRAISAALGTACIPVAYSIARGLAGRIAGLMAALLVACAVVQLRESHFFTVDISMLFFSAVTWWLAQRLARTGQMREYILAGVTLGAALACKYSAAFLVPVLGLAHLCAPNRPQSLSDGRGWTAWIIRGLTPLVIAAAVFVAVDPMAVTYYAKFRQDIHDWVINPASGEWRPIFIAQFADIRHPALYWFTNLLWWGLGPAFEIVGLSGLLWLVLRRDRQSLIAASFSVAYYLAAAQTVAPHIRYAAPLAVGLGVAAGVLCADLLERRPRRWLGVATALVVCVTTALYAAAYMNVFLSPDSRLVAADWIRQRIPADSKLLIEPSHNIPPLGAYRNRVDFNQNYVAFADSNGNWEKHDVYQIFALDTYRFLYNPGVDDKVRQEYLDSKLALADWIVMDDTFLQFYEHLPESTHGVAKRYYRDLFAGRLGFHLVKTFKVYPSLFGHAIDDDGAELTFRLFDHPRVFIFARQPASRSVT